MHWKLTSSSLSHVIEFQQIRNLLVLDTNYQWFETGLELASLKSALDFATDDWLGISIPSENKLCMVSRKKPQLASTTTQDCATCVCVSNGIAIYKNNTSTRLTLIDTKSSCVITTFNFVSKERKSFNLFGSYGIQGKLIQKCFMISDDQFIIVTKAGTALFFDIKKDFIVHRKTISLLSPEDYKSGALILSYLVNNVLLFYFNNSTDHLAHWIGYDCATNEEVLNLQRSHLFANSHVMITHLSGTTKEELAGYTLGSKNELIHQWTTPKLIKGLSVATAKCIIVSEKWLRVAYAYGEGESKQHAHAILDVRDGKQMLFFKDEAPSSFGLGAEAVDLDYSFFGDYYIARNKRALNLGTLSVWHIPSGFAFPAFKLPGKIASFVLTDRELLIVDPSTRSSRVYEKNILKTQGTNNLLRHEDATDGQSESISDTTITALSDGYDVESDDDSLPGSRSLPASRAGTPLLGGRKK